VKNVIGRAGKYNICFREDVLSSHSGLLLVKEFAEKLGISEILDEELKVKSRERGFSESASIMALVYNLIAGGECLSDLNVLRGDSGTLKLLDVESLIAPTTAGEFVRKFDIGDIHDLNRAISQLQQRIRSKQKAKVCTIDLDSSIYEQASHRKEGSTKAYNGEIGYHPLLAFWEEEGELIFSHLRRGSAYTSSKAKWFLNETLTRLPNKLPKKMRADTGFYDKEMVALCEQEEIIFGISADQTQPLMNKAYEIAEADWLDLEKYGVAQVSELRYQPINWDKNYRYIVKREIVQGKNWEHYFR
jgi:hypothetical protein